MRGPSEVEMRCIGNKEGLANIVYTPTEPGIYTLSVTFSGICVTGKYESYYFCIIVFLFLGEFAKCLFLSGSPFTINCTGEGLGNLKESVIVDLKQVHIFVKLSICQQRFESCIYLCCYILLSNWFNS